MVPTRIFVSYRRDDSELHTNWLCDLLGQRFGPAFVFRDRDNIRSGDDFAQVIESQISQCKILIVVIGQNWLSCTNQSGSRRLDDSKDFVRLEIETALERGIRVIPVLVGGASMPHPDQLPPTLASLPQLHALVPKDENFQDDIKQQLIKTLEDRDKIPPMKEKNRLAIAATATPIGGLAGLVAGVRVADYVRWPVSSLVTTGFKFGGGRLAWSALIWYLPFFAVGAFIAFFVIKRILNKQQD